MSTEITKSRPTIDWATLILLTTFHLIALYGVTQITPSALIAFGIMYAVSVLGITVGFHRYFTHKAFKASKAFERLLAVMGTLALQGSLRKWVAHHRMHHNGSDTIRDPHNANRGFWYCHLGWMMLTDKVFDDQAFQDRLTRDIQRDPFLMFISKGWVIIGLQIVFGVSLWAIWGVETMLWGVFVRLVAVYHVTWCVNSVCHMFGYKNYPILDRSKNNWVVGLLAFGEGWHNNHHAIEYSARHGLRWWEFDLSYYFIRLAEVLGQAKDLRIAQLPSESDEEEEEVTAVAMS